MIKIMITDCSFNRLDRLTQNKISKMKKTPTAASVSYKFKRIYCKIVYNKTRAAIKLPCKKSRKETSKTKSRMKKN